MSKNAIHTLYCTKPVAYELAAQQGDLVMNHLRLTPATVIAALLAGCGSIPPMPVALHLAPELRWKDPKDCRDEQDCQVTVNPHLVQWVPEYIRSKNGRNIHFRIKYSDVEFAEPGVEFKSDAGVKAFHPCTVQDAKRQHIKCTNNGAEGGEYAYGLRVRLGKDGPVVPYDPFVWNK